MESQTNLGWDVLLDLDAFRGPVSERLTAAIRAAIRDGRLPHATALPPSRALAEELDLSRWTVTRAYGQLVAECYLEARTGSATRVRWMPEPDDRPRPVARQRVAIAFDMGAGQPDLRAFPRRRWLQALGAAAGTASYDELGAPEPGGSKRLRTVLAAYLNRVRGAAAEPDAVSVCFGAGQAMLRIATALRADGHTSIAVEDPGPTRLWQAASLAGLNLVPIPVDEHGLLVSALAEHPSVRAVCVGATHQYPLGVVLAPHRRAALLEWATRVDGLIVEDDYDAEFRYDRPTAATMQGMAPRRVALIGSVSKSLGPAVGIGWAVTPPHLTATLRSDDSLLLMPSVLNQLGLAEFLDSGAYDRHLRAARSRFRTRRTGLIAALERIPDCTITGAEAGLHFLFELPANCDAAEVTKLAARRGLSSCYLDDCRIRPDPTARQALVLGYGNLADGAIAGAAEVLATTIASVSQRPHN